MTHRFEIECSPRPAPRPRVSGRRAFMPGWYTSLKSDIAAQLPDLMLEEKLAVRLQVRTKHRRKADLDNYAKTILDACTDAGIWLDDSQIFRLEVSRTISPEEGVLLEIFNHDSSNRQTYCALCGNAE